MCQLLGQLERLGAKGLKFRDVAEEWEEAVEPFRNSCCWEGVQHYIGLQGTSLVVTFIAQVPVLSRLEK